MAAAEVRNGDFIYRDTLFVDLGPNKRHPRASAQDLKDLLLPKSGSAPKDQVAHWYEAQLIHYGLPRSKDKNTAKVRLTNALASKALALPKEIVAMEGEMKKQYASALRRARSGGGGSGGGGAAVAAGKSETKVVGNKAKKVTSTSTNTSKTTVELEVDGMKITIDREALRAAAKTKTTTGKSTASKGGITKAKGAKTSDSKPKAATAAKTVPAKATAAGKSSSGKPAASALPPSRPRSEAPKQTARRGNHSGYSVTDRPIPSSSPEKTTGAAAPKPRARQTARRGKVNDPSHRTDLRAASSPSQTYDHTPYSFQHDVDMDDAPPSYDSIDFDQQRDSSSTSEDFAISGTYFFPRHSVQPFSLTLQVDERSRRLWGSFHIGSKEGVLCMDDISGIASGEAVSFGWRSEDQDDGFMKFGRGCDGTMEFDGEGWIRGQFHGLMYGEDVEFGGTLVNEEGLDVREMKHIWDEFPRKAYGRG